MMSTCPEKDIHSIYVDSELPSQYRARYTEHLRGCERCRERSKRMERLHGLLREDAGSITLSGQELDESFLRLEARMSYHAVTNRAPHISFPSIKNIKWTIPTAAALLLAVLVPLRMRNEGAAQPLPQQNAAQAVSFRPVSSAQSAPVSYVGRNSASVFGRSASIWEEPASPVRGMTGTDDSAGNSVIRLVSDDMFRPNFSGGGQSFSIRIELYPVSGESASTEFYIPLSASAASGKASGMIKVLLSE